MLSIAGSFGVVHWFCFVLVFKHTAVQPLVFVFAFIFVFVSQHTCCD